MGQQRAVHGLLADEVHALARQEVQAVAICLVVGDGVLVLRRAEAHHRLKEMALALLDILPHGVQVGGELHAGGEQTLALLALGLAVQLLPPLGHKPEAGLIGRQDLDLLAAAVQLVPGGGVLPRGVGTHVRRRAGVHHLAGAVHQGVDVDARHGDGQQPHGGQHAVPAAHVVGHHKRLIALGVRQRLQRASVPVGGGVDALGGPLRSVLLLQQLAEEAERHCRLCGGAGFGDDIDGEVHAVQQLHDLAHVVGGQAVAHEVDVGGVLLFQIVVGGAQALDHAPGAQIGAADADDHQRLRVRLDARCRGLDAGKLLLVVVLRQAHPAGKVAAGAVTLLQMVVGDAQAGRQRRLVGQRDKAVAAIEVHTDHRMIPPW